ncbi:PREDICTED: uncharacterized protein LOC104596204 [Nelumbo nucifera]|uniref:Uncharacterized protein LOC104596204 n=1 Tax=Nelumbo nucifera TaxID=4432 RepID=A0A1U8A1S1_NELNU|nr:PREDICTED: uncharacterized protein LOC104596204 [Nelumbo nucifera]
MVFFSVWLEKARYTKRKYLKKALKAPAPIEAYDLFELSSFLCILTKIRKVVDQNLLHSPFQSVRATLPPVTTEKNRRSLANECIHACVLIYQRHHERFLHKSACSTSTMVIELSKSHRMKLGRLWQCKIALRLSETRPMVYRGLWQR